VHNGILHTFFPWTKEWKEQATRSAVCQFLKLLAKGWMNEKKIHEDCNQNKIFKVYVPDLTQESNVWNLYFLYHVLRTSYDSIDNILSGFIQDENLKEAVSITQEAGQQAGNCSTYPQFKRGGDKKDAVPDDRGFYDLIEQIRNCASKLTKDADINIGNTGGRQQWPKEYLADPKLEKQWRRFIELPNSPDGKVIFVPTKLAA